MAAEKRRIFEHEDALEYVVLAAIVAAALYFRLRGAWFSYPLITHADEPALVRVAGRMLRTLDPNPHFFNYPSLVIYLQAATMAIVSAARHTLFGTAPDAIPQVDFHVAGRIVATIGSAASIVFTYLAGRRWFNAPVGLFAAAVTAVSPLHIYHSALVTTDIWVATFSSLVLLCCARVFQDGGIRNYVMAGVFVGLAAGAKYTAVVFFFGVIAAHVLSRPFSVRSLFARELIVSGASTVVTFLLTTPYALLDARTFLSHVAFESAHYREGHPGNEAAGGTSWHLYADALMSTNGLGHVVAALVIVSLFFAFRRGFRPLIVVLSVPFALFLFVGNYKVFFDRNIVGAVPGLAIAAGAAIYAVARQIPLLRNQARVTALIFAAVFVIAAAPLVSKAIDDVEARRLPDTRWVSLAWIRQNIPGGAKVAVEGYAPPVAEFDRRLDVVQMHIAGIAYDRAKIDESVEYVILSSGSYGRFFEPSGEPREAYRSEAQLYADFFSGNELVYEARPERGVLAGPVIRVFKRVPPAVLRDSN